MKALFCEGCGDIVAPDPIDFRVRWCGCGRHAIWWRNGAQGLLSVHDKYRTTFPDPNDPAVTRFTPSKAFVLGLNNRWLMHPAETLTRSEYQQIVAETPPGYIFAQVGSVAIRFRPGHSSDTQYDSLPGAKPN